MDDSPLNQALNVAKVAKQDEFYTQFDDIEKEVEAYLEYDPNTFRGKVVYCNCDNPFESNFFKYFADNFGKLGLKKLVVTGRNATLNKPRSMGMVLENGKDKSFVLAGDGRYQGGDFRSAECIELLKQADVVVTNPPFSLFRKYVAQLVEHDKKFLIIGNVNAITYKEIFPLIKEGKLWLGATIHNGDREFRVPDHYLLRSASQRIDSAGFKYTRVSNVRWFTNLDHGRRHQPLKLMTMAENLKYSKHKEIRGKQAYDKYDNYDAIEVPLTIAIPSDYDGVMGVPITFLDKHCPEQFEILWTTDRGGDGMLEEIKKPHTRFDAPVVKGVGIYKRILIRHRRGKQAYDKYDNYDAIEVPFVDAIPSDHDGVMGVPITFLDKYNSEQFEIVGTTGSNDPSNAFRTRVYTSHECRAGYEKLFGKPGVYDLNASGVVNGVKVYTRLLIRHRRNKPAQSKEGM